MIHGSIVAIVSPMHADGTLDFDGLRKLVDWHIAEGTNGIVIVGTTGESPTVDFDEHIELVRVTVEQAAGRVPVIAGTGANATREAVELAKAARKVGANAQLSVVPYYNKPTQEGLFQHFKAVSEAEDLPLYLYNVPGRTVADLQNATVLRLAELPGIVGLKDATGDLVRHVELLRQLPKGKEFGLYSGNDDSALAYMLMGGTGVISVTANVAPRAMSEMCAAAREGNIARARAINDKLFDLHTKLFVESNPAPTKWALHRMGHIGTGIRLPLVQLSEGARPVVEAALFSAGVL
ncbi:4-hydroxy-tetrahydrodipicolinate synthase [Derxia gummosa]|uniref:4-hydroxy-tetrahydrodipicolinate synthase n=1 Tax=Derxia gummosa DSM 723 TaxID=1121388 RepID=A0A8B6X3K5_9BURK|nr:4-hydroxy-tetrahydrodipicolinate synthase [Derxia gummosa]